MQLRVASIPPPRVTCITHACYARSSSTIGKVLSRGQMSRRNRSNVVWRKKFPAGDAPLFKPGLFKFKPRPYEFFPPVDKVETAEEGIRDVLRFISCCGELLVVEQFFRCCTCVKRAVKFKSCFLNPF